MNDLPQYVELVQLLARVGYQEDAAEYHGSLCGMLCVRPLEDINLLQLVEMRDAAVPVPDAQTRATLDSFGQRVLDTMLSNQMVFAPLLPDDDEPLAVRVQCLSFWCQGFLYGLAAGRQLDLQALSEQAQEIVQDLTQFTQADVSSDGDEEIEEKAFAELVEYVRVGAQLLFMELHPTADGEQDLPPTLH